MVARALKAASLSEHADGATHSLVRDTQESSSDLLDCEGVVLARVDLFGELCKEGLAGFEVQRLVLVRPEDLGEVLGEETSQNEVGIGDGQRTALAVACGAGVSGRRLVGQLWPRYPTHLWTNDKHAVAVEQARATTSGDSVDIELRGLDNDLGGGGLEHVLELAIVAGHVCAGTSHIDGDERPAVVARLGVSDNTASRATKDGAEA
jgi:hypothetical protein